MVLINTDGGFGCGDNNNDGSADFDHVDNDDDDNINTDVSSFVFSKLFIYFNSYFNKKIQYNDSGLYWVHLQID